jgi:hypothetical protein
VIVAVGAVIVGFDRDVVPREEGAQVRLDLLSRASQSIIAHDHAHQ